MVVEFGLGFRAASVAMRSYACGEFCGLGIAQDRIGKIDQVPVVIEDHDLRSEMGVAEGGSEIFADEGGLFFGGHSHAGKVAGNVARFVRSEERRVGEE